MVTASKMESMFKPPEPFNFNGTDVAQRWAKWRKTFETYFTAAEINKKEGKVQIAILLHTAGSEAQEIHDQFVFGESEDKNNCTTVLNKFGDYCNPQKNTVFERYRFWSKEHVESEPIDKWVKDVKTISANCDFKDEDDQIRDKIVFAYKDNKIKERMLRESSKLTLKKAMEICRAAESTRDQMKSMSSSKAEDIVVQELRQSAREYSTDRVGNRERSNTDGQFRCYNCDGIGHFSRHCPRGDSSGYPRGRSSSRRGRSGSRSNSRGGRGRSSSGARNRYNDRNNNNRTFYDVEQVSQTTDSPLAEFQTLSLSTVSVNWVSETNSKTVTKRYVSFDFFNNKAEYISNVDLKVDSGSEDNLMPNSIYSELYPERVGPDGKPLAEFIEKSDAKLTAYGGSEIEHLGRITVPCSYNGLKFMAKFYLSDAEGPMLLGLPLGEKLGIITIVTNVNSVNSEMDMKNNDTVAPVTAKKSNTAYIERDTPLESRPTIRSKEDLREMYPECFTNGPENHFPNYKYHITLKPDACGKIHAPRRQPLELQEPIKKELERMVMRGAITKVNEPTDWVNSMTVTTRANGSIRICLDANELNKVIMREHYTAAVVQDKTHLLNGSDTFTKLDLKDGYWHVQLDEESSYLTTFNTPFGRYRYLVMPNGLNVSQDIF